MTLTLIALLASSSIATGSVNIRVSVAHQAVFNYNYHGVAVELNSPASFQTRREGRVIIIVPQ